MMAMTNWMTSSTNLCEDTNNRSSVYSLIMQITVTNLTTTKTYSYLEMLREIQVGNLYLINISTNQGATGTDYLVIKFANTVAYYADPIHGLGMYMLMDPDKNTFSNIRRVRIDELKLSVLER